jgi:hypothetical protein
LEALGLGAGFLSSLMEVSAFGSGLGFIFRSFASFEDTPRFGASDLAAAFEEADPEASIELSALCRYWTCAQTGSLSGMFRLLNAS